MNGKSSKKTWQPAVVGLTISILGILVLLICNTIDTCNDSSCVYSVVGYFIPLACLEIVVPYGISLTASGVIYYLFDKFILSKKNCINKDYSFLLSFLMSVMLFYPAHELVAYVIRLILF